MTLNMDNFERDYKPPKIFQVLVFYARWFTVGTITALVSTTWFPFINTALDARIYLTDTLYINLLNVTQQVLILVFLLCVVFSNKKIDLKNFK